MNDRDLDIEDDDRTIGRVLSRREVLLLLGAGTGAIALAASARTPAGRDGSNPRHRAIELPACKIVVRAAPFNSGAVKRRQSALRHFETGGASGLHEDRGRHAAHAG